MERYQCWAPAPWAPRSPRTSRTRASCAAAGRQTRSGARRLEAGARPQARPVFHAETAVAHHDRRIRRRISRASADTDWIIEAVVEQLDVKRALLETRRRRARAPGPIVSSNTSGIPIAALAEGRSDDFRRHWLGTHFFNPPRYLRLARSDPDAGHRSRPWSSASRGSPIFVSAKASSSRRTRRISSPITSGCSASIQMLRALEIGRLHDRRDRRDHRARSLGRPEERDVSHAGHRRPRRPRPRRAQSAERLPTMRGRVSRCRRSSIADRARLDRREGRAGFLQAQRAREILDARSGDADVSPEADAVDLPSLDAAARHRGPRRARQDAVSRPATRSARSCARRSGRRCSIRRASRPISPTRSTMSIGRCGGDSAGSSVRSRSGTRSAFAKCWTRCRAGRRSRRSWRARF